ncbi:hypothetical protein FD41_GL000071 [Lentilactobacillus farraginis DSM 18382 = JCM 14108]|uniref:Uncharacterized protein n=1 Tax=Lentilactobacillus farraginis DSM 18382 = JCM 14108 TaxID=1423743 RepID=X0PI65_9LACO|nr:hypothetical protein FD41_GL000071 [Lentilactobacillus farraginis DSM 18382 = JCM 14108]GAF36782.1 hypothetical protein JCM14108_1766 [Lentilactobacillus farraginis DSM 18382 = JCM 14108]
MLDSVTICVEKGIDLVKESAYYYGYKNEFIINNLSAQISHAMVNIFIYWKIF